MLCLVLPLALGLDRGVRHESAGVPAAADVDAPLPDEAPADSSAGRLAECRTTLRDPEQYAAAALAAEEVLFGGAAGGLPSGDASGAAAVVAALAALPRLQVPLVFWVLHSDVHPYSERFAAAATTQVRFTWVGVGGGPAVREPKLLLHGGCPRCTALLNRAASPPPCVTFSQRAVHILTLHPPAPARRWRC